MPNSSFFSRATYAILLLGLLVLSWTNFSQRELHFDDERWYLENVDLLQQHGLSSEFLLEYRGSAGPLFAVVHWILSPLTQLQPPGLHLVNLGFLLLSIWVLGLLLAQRSSPEQGRESLYLLAVPMMYVCAGMVLTEMPALFFLSLSLWTLEKWRTQSETGSNAWGWLIAAALSFSLAILGRQVYLILLPLLCLPMLRAWPSPPLSWLKAWPHVLVFSVVTLIVPLVVFYHWQGLTSIFDAKIYAQYAERGISYAPIHVLFALGYMALLTLLIAPRFFQVLLKEQLRWWSLGAGLALVVVNLSTGWFEYFALEGVAKQLLPEVLLPWYGRMVAGGLLALAGGFSAAALLHAWTYRKDRWFLLSVLACLGIALTSLKITHQFSSRYVAQALPFLLLLWIRFPETGWWQLVGKAIGLILGIAALYSYF